ncbi:MAG: glycosyltransferase family 2 protein [Chloroflexi bacterium]|mgnify:CR=1 FL=1|jgi:GT2 family glycosyltransferase|nr:glycosyltransferase family 2 protein [Chloroflexota bacterium]
MTESRHKIAFIVPTRNRFELPTQLLDSLQIQSIQADQVVVSDGSYEPIEPNIRGFLSPNIECMRAFPPGLTKQRNAGIRALGADITLAGFLDDDMVFGNDAIESMLRFWEHCEDAEGTWIRALCKRKQ